MRSPAKRARVSPSTLSRRAYAVEAEAGHVAEAADALAVVPAAEGVGRVLDDAQAVPGRKGVDLVQLPGVAGVVHVHDGEGILRKPLLAVGQIDGAGLRQDLAGYGRDAAGRAGLEGGHEGEGGHENGAARTLAELAGRNGVHGQRQG